MDALKFPIGRFDWTSPLTGATREEALAAIEALPVALSLAVADLTDAQLATPYRPEGWTVAQVVHHLADSHMNGVTRVKLGLTEQIPTITPYNEAEFARLADMTLPVVVSLRLLDSLHTRWSALLASMTEADYRRLIVHPQHGTASLDRLVHLYGWHSRHHVGQITALRARLGW